MAGGTLARRGYSRDQRPDCRQVCIGLVVTPEGLPVGYEVFAGNRTDVTALPGIVTAMEEKYGQSERIWVVDRGMVSDDNLAFLRARRARYIVGTPKAQLRDFAAALREAKDWPHVREDVEVKLLAHPDGQGQEQFVLCRSQARREKEKAMLARQQQRLLEKLLALDTRLRARPARDAGRIERSVGRWLGRYPAVAKIYEVRVERDDASGAAVATRSVNSAAERIAGGSRRRPNAAARREKIEAVRVAASVRRAAWAGSTVPEYREFCATSQRRHFAQCGRNELHSSSAHRAA